MPALRRGNNVASGLLLVAIGGYFAWSGRALEISTMSNMGPGYFPLILSCLLILLGVLVIFVDAPPVETEPARAVAPIPWRGVVLLTAALLFFALLVRPMGLGPSLAGAVAISSLASRKWRPLPTLIMTAVMAACGWAVFIKLLGMPVPFLGPWIH